MATYSHNHLQVKLIISDIKWDTRRVTIYVNKNPGKEKMEGSLYRKMFVFMIKGGNK